MSNKGASGLHSDDRYAQGTCQQKINIEVSRVLHELGHQGYRKGAE